MGLQTISAGFSDPGKSRKYNEDSFLNAPERGLWVVADGMGGHAAGDVASGMIVERLGKIAPPADPVAFLEAVENELLGVNQALREQAQQRRVSLIGATVVALLAGKDFMMCGWAGDSRIYRYSSGKLKQLSRDHSMNQEMMDTGQFTVESLKAGAQSNAITRAVGGEEKLYLDWSVADFSTGAQFLLCSDGLNKEVPDERIEQEFAKQLPPKQTAENLVRIALEHGGRDNVTTVVVSVSP